jgi:hypothetical protein
VVKFVSVPRRASHEKGVETRLFTLYQKNNIYDMLFFMCMWKRANDLQEV